MDLCISAPATATVAVAGTASRFPVRRIFCIGRNYAAHAREMGAEVERGSPVFFMKPADCVVTDGADVPYPPATGDLHHEVEMVVALAGGGRDLAPDKAAGLVFGHGVGLDLTRRDLQARAKARGLPWDTAKGFDHSAPVSAIVPVTDGAPDADTLLSLEVNGKLRQQAHLADMLWKVEEIIAELSRLFELKPGDLLFTGTPAGVAALQRGDRFVARLGGLARLEGRIV